MKVVVLDVETTGLPQGRNISPKETHKWPYVVQFSWLVYDMGTNKLLKYRDHIIALPQGYVVPAESARIHGITTEKMRAEGVPLKPLLTEFKKDMQDCHTLVAHNVEFDRNVLEAEYYRHHFTKTLQHIRKIEFCTMQYSKALCGIEMIHPYSGKKVFKYPKLLELHQTLFGSVPDNLHNSLIDIMVCFRCFYKMYWDTDILDVNQAFAKLWAQYCDTQLEQSSQGPSSAAAGL
jgi:DNA polymerase III epsilon subunit-like protein